MAIESSRKSARTSCGEGRLVERVGKPPLPIGVIKSGRADERRQNRRGTRIQLLVDYTAVSALLSELSAWICAACGLLRESLGPHGPRTAQLLLILDVDGTRCQREHFFGSHETPARFAPVVLIKELEAVNWMGSG